MFLHSLFDRRPGFEAFRIDLLGLTLTCSLLLPPALAVAQSDAARAVGETQGNAEAPADAKYSPQVVEKAESILQEVGLRRSGKTIQLIAVPEVSKPLAAIPREKRELRKAQQEWQVVDDRMTAVRRQLERLNLQHGESNLQLARVAGNVIANNRIVAMINATNAKTKALTKDLEKLKEELAKKRSALSDVESSYAEKVLQARERFNTMQRELESQLEQEPVKIALQVMHTNFGSPERPELDSITAALDRRIERIEADVFRESIPLQQEQGSLYADVVIGKTTLRMVVDSGATLLSLPHQTAVKLGIELPANARELRLVLADGRTIPAKAVTIPKVRVGQFEVENVETAVLDPVADQAEPLLGMSFLGEFKFEIDTSEKTLKLLRIESQ